MSSTANVSKVAALLAVPLALGLAACGGPSKSSLVKKADGICRTTNLNASTKKPTSYPELGESAKSLATATDDQVAKLAKLSVPGGDKATVKAVFASIGGVATAAHRLQDSAAKVDDKATAAATNDASTSARDASDKAKAYGFTSCGSGTQAAAAPVADGAKGIVKAAFVAKAEGICKESRRKAGDIREPSSSANLSTVGRYFDSLLAVSNKAAADVHGLAVPPGDEAEVGRWLDDVDKLNAKLKDLTAAAKQGDRAKTLAAVDEVQAINTQANAKADQYGVRACGTGSINS